MTSSIAQRMVSYLRPPHIVAGKLGSQGQIRNAITIFVFIVSKFSSSYTGWMMLTEVALRQDHLIRSRRCS